MNDRTALGKALLAREIASGGRWQGTHGEHGACVIARAPPEQRLPLRFLMFAVPQHDSFSIAKDAKSSSFELCTLLQVRGQENQTNKLDRLGVKTGAESFLTKLCQPFAVHQELRTQWALGGGGRVVRHRVLAADRHCAHHRWRRTREARQHHPTGVGEPLQTRSTAGTGLLKIAKVRSTLRLRSPHREASQCCRHQRAHASGGERTDDEHDRNVGGSFLECSHG
jgi:hypothetical protein